MITAFVDTERGAFAPEAEGRNQTFEHNRGRTGQCACIMLGGPGLGEWVASSGRWPGLRSLIQVWTIQQNSRLDASIGLLCGLDANRGPWPLPGPERDFAVVLGWLQTEGGPT